MCSQWRTTTQWLRLDDCAAPECGLACAQRSDVRAGAAPMSQTCFPQNLSSPLRLDSSLKCVSPPPAVSCSCLPRMQRLCLRARARVCLCVVCVCVCVCACVVMCGCVRSFPRLGVVVNPEVSRGLICPVRPCSVLCWRAWRIVHPGASVC